MDFVYRYYIGGMCKHRCQINNNISIRMEHKCLRKIKNKILITCKLFEG